MPDKLYVHLLSKAIDETCLVSHKILATKRVPVDNIINAIFS